MKRALSIILAITLLFAVCVPFMVSAAETGTITINNAVNGETYTIYRMADLVSFSGSSFSYKISAGWEEFLTTPPSTDWFLVNTDGYLTTVPGTQITAAGSRKMAREALNYATTKKIAAVASKTADGNAVVFENLPLGWYLVDSSLGTLCSVDTTNTTVNIEDKNQIPTVDKNVKEDSTGNYVKENSAAIHQEIEYQIELGIADGAVNYEIHDTMTRLKFKEGSLKITHKYTEGDNVQQSEEVAATNYTFTLGKYDTESKTQSFTIKFNDEYLSELGAKDFLIVDYVATLTDDAVIATKFNPNEVYLTYGNEQETEKITTKTYTYAFDLVKTDGAGQMLDGATFKLYLRSGNATAGYTYTEVKLYEEEANVYHVAAADEEAKDIAVQKDYRLGVVTVKGLDANTTYYLKEITAPAGYNLLKEYIEVAFQTSNLTLTTPLGEGDVYDRSVNGGIEVVNKTGAELPATGGMGTTLFILVGSILVLGAGVLLATKVRMAKMAD